MLMPTTIPTKEDVALALDRVADSMRLQMPTFVKLGQDGSGPARMLARRDVFGAFPAPSDVLFIDANGLSDGSQAAPSWTLVRFDLSRPGINEVNFIGRTATQELPSLRKMLTEHFGIEDSSLETLPSPRLISSWNEKHYVFLSPHDILSQPEQYGQELGRCVGIDSNLAAYFSKPSDFNVRYGLSPDLILSTPELLKLNADAEMSPSSPRRLSLQQLQENISDIQLIPQVTDSVKEVINRAKKLYVYGFFEYGFFTVSQHYAYAALEAALHARWSQSLPRPSKLKYQKNKTTSTEVFTERTAHVEIKEYCRTQNWKVQKVLVNGRFFPYTAGMLLGWLRQDKSITEWQEYIFDKSYLPLRNSMSHMEQCSTWMSDSGVLRRAVEAINVLFDSLPLSQSAQE
jgi:hypothetical protein